MIGKLERSISLLGSLASILGISVLSVVAIIQSFREHAFEIGQKILLSMVSFVGLAIFFPLFMMVFGYLLNMLFRMNQLDENYEDDLGIINIAETVYTVVSLVVFIGSLIGLLLIIWNYEFR